MNNKLSWNELLIIGGFLFEQNAENRFNFSQEKNKNRMYLDNLLRYNQVKSISNQDNLEINSSPLEISRWVESLKRFGGKGQECSSMEDMELEGLDVPIAGVVRQINKLGIRTIGSCSGHSDHGRRSRFPFVDTQTPLEARILGDLIKDLGFNSRYARPTKVEIMIETSKLFDIALLLSEIKHIERYQHTILEKRENLLEEILNIPGETYHEELVRQYVKRKLDNLMDAVWEDKSGNLLAVKNYGKGPTIMLSGHMDIYEEILPESCLIKNGSIWTRNKGILGADDRAGIAMIINILEDLEAFHYRGMLKIVFTIEEEKGQTGAENIDKAFFENIDYAISLDRKNGHDVVTHSSIYTYSSEEYGQVFERASNHLWDGNHPYKITCGGISDLRVWSQLGIDSVNLSVGYYEPHSTDEYLNLNEWHRTYDLLIYSMELLYREYQSKIFKERFQNN
jgi:hypothetical protein